IGHPLAAGGWALVALLVLGVTAIALRRRGRATDAPWERLSTSLICIATLMAVHHFAYDLLLLTLPVLALAGHRLPSGFLNRRWEVVLFVLYGILAANYLGSGSVMSRLEGYRSVYLVVASLNGLALLVIFLIYTVRVIQTAARPMESRSSSALTLSGEQD